MGIATLRRQRRAAETARDILANAAILQRAAVVELDLQRPGARIVANGAQSIRIDLLHFHAGIMELFRASSPH